MTPRLAGRDVPLAVAIALLAALAMLVLIGPVVVVVISSFSASATLAFPPPGLTLRWYAELLDPVRSEVVQAAALNSVLVACGATVLATLVATPAALAISRSQARWARVAEACFMAPLVLPGIAFGLAMLMFVSWLGFGSSLPAMVLGHTVVIGPYVLRNVVASASGLDPALLDASAALGASGWTTFRRVILPLIRPGVLAGAFLAFIASLDNIPVSLFLGSARTDMLPVRMWGMMETSLDVRVAAASGLLVGLSLLLLLLMDRSVGLTQRLSG